MFNNVRRILVVNINNRHIIFTKSQGLLQTPQDIMELYNGCSVPQYTAYTLNTPFTSGCRKDVGSRLKFRKHGESPMDEFAELEKELMEEKNSPTPSLKHILNLLDSGKLEVDFIIESLDEELTSGYKWGLLAVSIVLTPIVIGFFLLWILFASGTLKNINSTTHTISGRYYLRFYHSILQYESVDGRLTEAKLTTLGDNSYVSDKWVSFGDDGTMLAFYVYDNDNNGLRLWSCGATLTRGKENFQEVYQKVKDLCEVSGLMLDVSELEKSQKYAKWMAEMS